MAALLFFLQVALFHFRQLLPTIFSLAGSPFPSGVSCSFPFLRRSFFLDLPHARTTLLLCHSFFSAFFPREFLFPFFPPFANHAAVFDGEHPFFQGPIAALSCRKRFRSCLFPRAMTWIFFFLSILINKMENSVRKTFLPNWNGEISSFSPQFNPLSPPVRKSQKTPPSLRSPLPSSSLLIFSTKIYGRSFPSALFPRQRSLPGFSLRGAEPVDQSSFSFSRSAPFCLSFVSDDLP